jgi:hypothetical protein
MVVNFLLGVLGTCCWQPSLVGEHAMTVDIVAAVQLPGSDWVAIQLPLHSEPQTPGSSSMRTLTDQHPAGSVDLSIINIRLGNCNHLPNDLSLPGYTLHPDHLARHVYTPKPL